MKKTLLVILVFAVVLAALFGVTELVNSLRPETEQESAAEIEAKKDAWDNVLNIAGATRLDLNGDTVLARGEGVSVTGATVTIVYPGTYSLSGALSDGQIIVDSSNDGPVFLVLNGADITCTGGPAIFVKNAGSVELYLSPETQNALRDGAAYETVYLADGTEDPDQPDAALFCRDDLTIDGEGALTVTGAYANAIRCKDLLTVAGGQITVSAAQDGVKATDGVTVSGGALELYCADDGICSNKGYVDIQSGAMNIACYGDGVSAFTSVKVTGGELTVSKSGEAIEAPAVYVEDGRLTLRADDKALSAAVADLESGVKASDCYVWVAGGTVFAEAPVPVKSEGSFGVSDGALFLTSLSAQENVIKAESVSLKGGLVFMSGYMAENPLPDTIDINSVFFKLASPAEAGTAVTLQSAEEGSEPFISYAPDAAYDAVCIAYAGLSSRDSYTIACGDTVSTAFTPATVLTTATVPVARSSRGFGGPSGGPRPF